MVDYWDNQPCGSKRSSLEPGTLGYFDEIRRNRYHVESHIPEFLGFREAGARRERVLELGCGIGTDAVSFALAGAHVTAMDSSSTSLGLAEEQARAYRVSAAYESKGRVSFVQCDAQQPLSPEFCNEYERVVSFGVIHHLEDPAAVLRNAYAALDHGGYLKVMVYHKYSSKWALCKLGLMQPEAQANVPVVRAYSRRQGRHLLEQAGFVEVQSQVKHVFPYRIPEYKVGVYRRSWQSLLCPYESLVGWHLLLSGRKP